MSYLRSPLWWIVFFGGFILIALFSQSIFGKDTDNSVGASFVGGIIWGALMFRWGALWKTKKN
jgi:hypothetical protein